MSAITTAAQLLQLDRKVLRSGGAFTLVVVGRGEELPRLSLVSAGGTAVLAGSEVPAYLRRLATLIEAELDG